MKNQREEWRGEEEGTRAEKMSEGEVGCRGEKRRDVGRGGEEKRQSRRRSADASSQL